MIISHRHKFIFFKTSKTAGTSIEIALSQFCGPDDIITPISPKDEELRSQLGYPGPQNYLAPTRDYSPWDWIRYLCKGDQKKRFYNHISAKAVSQLLDPGQFQSYFKFCVARNPWDRVISMYWWRYRTRRRPTLEQFLKSSASHSLKDRSFGLYTIDGDVAVDRICRFENLAHDLDEVRQHLGLPARLELPRAKGAVRQEKRSYREILGDAERQLIAELSQEEIGLLGYQF